MMAMPYGYIPLDYVESAKEKRRRESEQAKAFDFRRFLARLERVRITKQLARRRSAG